MYLVTLHHWLHSSGADSSVTEAKSKSTTEKMHCHLLATRCLSLTSDLSNQIWGEDLTMARWIIPINPPCTWPTWETSLVQLTLTLRLSYFSSSFARLKTEHTLSLAETRPETHKLFYQRVAAIIGQDDDINRCCVIGHTDAPILWFVLTEIKQICVRNILITSINPVQNRQLYTTERWILAIFSNRDICATVVNISALIIRTYLIN